MKKFSPCRALLISATIWVGGCNSLTASDRPADEKAVPVGLPNGANKDAYCPPAKSGQVLEVVQVLQTWVVCKYVKTSLATGFQDVPYFSLAISINQGGSKVNSVDDVGFWGRLGGMLHQNVTSAVMTLKISSSNIPNPPEVPIFVITRASDGSSAPKTSSPASTALPQQMQVMPYSLAPPTQQWIVALGYKFSSEANDHIASTAIQISKQVLKVYPVGGAIASLAPEITHNDREKLDGYVSGLLSYSLDPPQVAYGMTTSEYTQIDSIVAILYDDVLSSPQKQVVAYATLTPRFVPSLYATRDVQGQLHFPGIAEYGRFIPELGGSTRDLFNKNHPDLSRMLENGSEEAFRQVCNSGAQDFASYRLASDTDAVYATWLVLMSSPAADSKNPNLCTTVVLDSMADLHLKPFPFQVIKGDSDPSQRKENVAISNLRTEQLSAAFAQPDVDVTPFFAEKVALVQHQNVLSGIAVDMPVAVDGSSLASSLKAGGGTRLHSYKHTGLSSSVVKATLSTAGGSYPVTIRWSDLNKDGQITSIDLGAKATRP
ncbi:MULTISPECIES: hypothetical protein [unclassified Caballeronia]|uniref:hypothetical protein n=1 Tax=unclassified Caballeronia TaxID=2646786 RepID=UPI002028D746|nr:MULTISPECIES: hypothetical protein [unclassified Caballeronia]MDR5766156.1 hypothetical protein [Caballeronia sp. LZ028]